VHQEAEKEVVLSMDLLLRLLGTQQQSYAHHPPSPMELESP